MDEVCDLQVLDELFQHRVPVFFAWHFVVLRTLQPVVGDWDHTDANGTKTNPQGRGIKVRNHPHEHKRHKHGAK